MTTLAYLCVPSIVRICRPPQPDEAHRLHAAGHINTGIPWSGIDINHVGPSLYQDTRRRDNGPLFRRSQDGVNRLGFDRGSLCPAFPPNSQRERKEKAEGRGNETWLCRPTFLDQPRVVGARFRILCPASHLLDDHRLQQISTAKTDNRTRSPVTTRCLRS